MDAAGTIRRHQKRWSSQAAQAPFMQVCVDRKSQRPVELSSELAAVVQSLKKR